MEPLQSSQHQTDQQENGNNKHGAGGLVCRQTSTRWTPTTDQIRILKDLYYNGGVRSPTADQIQKISARLRQFGKIEGKNVFYWFQNHKARERQKKRFNGTNTAVTTLAAAAASASDHLHHHPAPAMQRSSSAYDSNNNDSIGVKLDQDHLFHNRSYPSFSNGNFYHASSGAECAINTYNGYIGGHGSMTVEKQFMDCSISPTGGSSGFNVGGWVSMDHHYSSPPPPPPHNFFNNKPKPLIALEGYEDDEDDDQQGDAYIGNRRTLPLFPMHGEDHINGGGGGFRLRPNQSDGDRRGHVGRCPYTSLELSLNSYTGVGPD